MFVAISRFVVANGLEERVCEAFVTRPHKVDSARGFQRMEVLRPQGAPAEFWLMTWWDDEAAFDTWHHSHAYHESHAGIPKGLKLVPGANEIRRFERVSD